MFYQFDNNYSALVSGDKFNIAYEEYFGNLFIRMSELYSSEVQKEILYNFVCMARLICGPTISALKDERNDSADLLRTVMHQWMKDYLKGYLTLLDGVNCFLVGAPDKLRSVAAFMENELKVVGTAMGAKYHALLLYKHELVHLYSAPPAQISTQDVGYLMTLSHGVLQNRKTQFYNAFLNGQQNYECIPHVVAITRYEEFSLTLILVVETQNTDIARSLHKSLSFLNKVYNFTVRLDADNVKAVVDKIDFHIGLVQQTLKAAKTDELDILLKSLERRWTTMKKKLAELIRVSYKDVLKQLDSTLPALIEALQNIFRVVYIDGQQHLMKHEAVCQLCESSIVNSLKGYHTIFSLNQHGQIVKSYMEEFPGLIHFIFVNKSSGRIIAPQLATDRPIIGSQTVCTGV